MLITLDHDTFNFIKLNEKQKQTTTLSSSRMKNLIFYCTWEGEWDLLVSDYCIVQAFGNFIVSLSNLVPMVLNCD
ncbi:hypothetical protein VIGAN_04091700 [Vigna angularis var. angularis]|uniref:Uncharacterized protein n=1 Tax=Vigna angularis var. angularis TaxID=157739 RepID=A0A0S3RSY5_PHAAN|nr:hypothetical protein VIGAN_04091700 [Vigna angularis var. angularis]